MLYYLRYYIKQIIPHFESFTFYRKFPRNFLIKQKKILLYKMRSAQTHLCAWAIMKNLSMCVMKNITCFRCYVYIVQYNYEQIMNKL